MNREEPDHGQLKHLLIVWEKVIDMQMHFNKLCMDLRRTGINIIGVLLAAGALAFRFGGEVMVFDKPVSVAFVFIGIALLAWVSFYLIDRFWYHQLLRSSVDYATGLSVNAAALGLGFPLDVSSKIRDENHKSLGLSGAAKVNWFYGLIGVVLFAAELILYFHAVTK